MKLSKKRIIALVLLLCVVVTLRSCTREKTRVKDYQYMYDGIVKAWNKAATEGCEREDLFGYGQYLYNSYLLLFPRETPSTLEKYYFYWEQGIDVDGYAIYFTCRLSEEDYTGFSDGLSTFTVRNGDDTIKPLFDDTHFSLPAYILQWREPGQKWEVLEYIMLDDQNNTAIFVYTMSELEHIEKHSAYTVAPSEMDFLDEDFSIYEAFENSTYDLSFLEYLK